MLAKIHDRKSFIEQLILDYPFFLKKWEDEQSDIFKSEAKENSEGDVTVEWSLYAQSMRAFDSDEDLLNYFYQAMLLVVYSYYEGILTAIEKSANPSNIESKICRSHHIVLSEESKQNISYISSVVRIVRRNICHHNAGTLKDLDALQMIVKKNVDLSLDDGVIYISDKKFILDALQKEYFVLLELAEKLGLKSRTI